MNFSNLHIRKTCTFLLLLTLCVSLFSPIITKADETKEDVHGIINVTDTTRVEIICNDIESLNIVFYAPDLTFKNEHVKYIATKDVSGHECGIYYLALPGIWNITITGTYTALAVITTELPEGGEVPLPPKDVIYSTFTDEVLNGMFDPTIPDATPTPLAFIPKVTDVPIEEETDTSSYEQLVLYAGIAAVIITCLFLFLNKNKKKVAKAANQKKQDEAKKKELARLKTEENRELATILEQTENEYIYYPPEYDFSNWEPNPVEESVPEPPDEPLEEVTKEPAHERFDSRPSINIPEKTKSEPKVPYEPETPSFLTSPGTAQNSTEDTEDDDIYVF